MFIFYRFLPDPSRVTAKFHKIDLQIWQETANAPPSPFSGGRKKQKNVVLNKDAFLSHCYSGGFYRMNLVKLRDKIGPEEFEAARAMYRRGGVREIQRTPEYLVYSVDGLHQYVRIYADGRGKCGCDKAPLCRHLGAMAMFRPVYRLIRTLRSKFIH